MKPIIIFSQCMLFLFFTTLGASMAQDINELNAAFYNESGASFHAIPFKDLLPDLIEKYAVGHSILEIGSGPGDLAIWLKDQGYDVTCVEPAEKFAKLASEKNLKVHPLTIQEFETDLKFDSILAISSLIHVPRKDLPSQIQKIGLMLRQGGTFFVSFIEGNGEGLEDPTSAGRMRYFAKWKESDLDEILSPYFDLLQDHRVYNSKMDRTFILRVYRNR